MAKQLCMYKKTMILSILLVIFSLPLLCQANSDFKVIFVNPGHPKENPTGNFWLNVTHFMEAAANDLNIELVTIYAHRNHILMKSLANEIISSSPNYVILVNEKGVAINIIKQVAAHDIPVFMLLNNISDTELASLSKKERKLIHGSLVPNNYMTGKKLLSGLVQAYELLPDKKEINISRSLLALQGDYNTPASIMRKQGLLNELTNHQGLNLIDSTVANWSKQQAYQKVKGILKRNRVDIIWAANDAMAFGAKKAIQESKIAYPIVIGGMNWDVKDEHYPVNLSFGGHVVLGAKSLVMLKDIYNNYLPSDKRHQVVDIFESSLSPFYLPFTQRLIKKQLEYYDFSRFSHLSNSKLHFTIENLEKTVETPR